MKKQIIISVNSNIMSLINRENLNILLPITVNYSITTLKEIVIKEITLDINDIENNIEKIILNFNDAPLLKQTVINELQKIINK